MSHALCFRLRLISGTVTCTVFPSTPHLRHSHMHCVSVYASSQAQSHALCFSLRLISGTVTCTVFQSTPHLRHSHMHCVSVYASSQAQSHALCFSLRLISGIQQQVHFVVPCLCLKLPSFPIPHPRRARTRTHPHLLLLVPSKEGKRLLPYADTPPSYFSAGKINMVWRLEFFILLVPVLSLQSCSAGKTNDVWRLGFSLILVVCVCVCAPVLYVLCNMHS